MRRTLALAGAAILGITGLAGPASADPGAGTTSDQPVVINEIGVNLLDAGASNDIDGAFLEIRNNTTSDFNVGGFRLIGCDANNKFTIATIPVNTILSQDETFLVADATYASGGGDPRNLPFAAGTDLLQSVGGAALESGSGVVQHDAKWGAPQDLDCVNFDPAGSTPNSDESMHYDSDAHTWSLADPTPTAAT